MKLALRIIFCVSLFGLCFSGYLSYQELFAGAESAGGGIVNGVIQPCPALGKPGTLLGYPACVYGFFMYLLIVVTSAWGLLAKR
jgi:uncharacterized membrane protein